MKLIYQSENYKVYEVTILGYKCEVSVASSGSQVGVPMGDTPEDKTMFDTLVYNKASVYNAKTPELAIQQVTAYIKAYKESEVKSQ